MKAIVYHNYGSPDVLELEEIEKPIFRDDQVLIKVHAASVNQHDWHFLAGTPLMAQLMLAVEFEESGWPWATKETGKRGWIPSEQLERFVRGPAADKNE